MVATDTLSVQQSHRHMPAYTRYGFYNRYKQRCATPNFRVIKNHRRFTLSAIIKRRVHPRKNNAYCVFALYVSYIPYSIVEL